MPIKRKWIAAILVLIGIVNLIYILGTKPALISEEPVAKLILAVCPRNIGGA